MSAENSAIRCLLDLTRKLLQGLSLEDSLQAVCEAALDLIPGDHASVRILDGSGTRLLSGARRGVGIDNTPMTFRLGEGAIGWVVAHRQAIRIDDAAQDTRFKQAHNQGFSIRSLLAVPLWCGGKVVGVVGTTAPEAGRFGEEAESLALLLANCVSPYVEKARLERLSITDPQTMAFNSNYLLPRLREEFERARRNETRVSLLVIELHKLSETARQHGDGVVDQVLQCFADRARASVRLSDILVRRTEPIFAMIMPDMALTPASMVADRIRHSLNEYPLEVAPLQLTLSTSLGVACWNGRESADEFTMRADAALSEARTREGSCIIRARHFPGRQLDASKQLECLRESCSGVLEQVTPAQGRTYFRCGSEACRSIWFFGN